MNGETKIKKLIALILALVMVLGLVAYYGWNNGGGYVDAEGNYIINSDANVKAYEWAKKLYDNGWTNKSPVTEVRDDLQKLVAGDKKAGVAELLIDEGRTMLNSQKR